MRSLEGDFHAAPAQGRGQTVRVIDLAQGGVGVKTGEALIENRQAVSSLCFRTPGKPGDSGHGSGVENVFQSGGKVFGSGAGATCAAGRLNMKKSEQPS